MRLGIGITTTINRISSTFNIENYKKYLSNEYEYIFYINVDSMSKGVSNARNNCITQLFEQGCEYIFLFDDDCYPIMYNFDKYFIENAIKYNVHYCLLPNVFNCNMLYSDNVFSEWENYLGCFAFYSKFCIDTIGYYNEKYEKYGYEDAAYLYRIKKSILCKDEKLITLAKTAFYIFSEDLYHRNPTENYNHEEKKFFIEKNNSIFQEELNNANNKKVFLGRNENIFK